MSRKSSGLREKTEYWIRDPAQKLDGFIRVGKNFSGKENEDITDWINVLENNFEVFEIADPSKVPFAACLLMGNAKDCHQNWSMEDPSLKRDWSKLKDKLIKTFKNVDYDVNMVNDLFKNKLSSSFEEYVAKFEKFKSLMRLSEDDYLRIIFTLGLPKKLKEKVVIKQPKSYALARDYAHKMFQLNKQEEGLALINQTDWQNKSRPKYCTFCAKEGHTVEFCLIAKRLDRAQKMKASGNINYQPRRAFSNFSSLSNKKPFSNLSKNNSLSNSSSNLTRAKTPTFSRFDKNQQNKQLKSIQWKNPAVVNRSRTQSGFNNQKQQVNSISVVKERDSEEILNYRISDRVEFIKSEITINGIKIKAIFDTGARTSSIPKSFVEKHNIPIERSINCQMANQLVEPSYLTQPLKVEVLGSISEFKVYRVAERGRIAWDGLVRSEQGHAGSRRLCNYF